MHVTIVSPYDPRPYGADGGEADPLALRGGVEEALERMAVGLAARGHDVSIVCSSPHEEATRVEDGVRRIRVKRHGALFRAPLARLGRAIPEDAEIVHVPATYPLVSDLVPLRESRRSRATVLDHHFDAHGTSALMRAAVALHRVTLARGMMRATRVVAKSRDYAANSSMLRGTDDIDIVPNGVDVHEFSASPAPRERTGILCVGRLVPYKGVDVLLRAMPRIHHDTGETLTIVGDGPERARLEALAPPGDIVRFAGRLPREDLVRAYGSARLTVLPSANGQEAFGIALLESMASGTPVVASELPGVREVARMAGLTAPAGDAVALATTIIDALQRPAGAFGTPSAIRARVAARYDWSVVLDKLEAVYRRALDTPASVIRAPHRSGRTTGSSAHHQAAAFGARARGRRV